MVFVGLHQRWVSGQTCWKWGCFGFFSSISLTMREQFLFPQGAAVCGGTCPISGCCGLTQLNPAWVFGTNNWSGAPHPAAVCCAVGLVLAWSCWRNLRWVWELRGCFSLYILVGEALGWAKSHFIPVALKPVCPASSFVLFHLLLNYVNILNPEDFSIYFWNNCKMPEVRAGLLSLLIHILVEIKFL